MIFYTKQCCMIRNIYKNVYQSKLASVNNVIVEHRISWLFTALSLLGTLD